MEETKMSMEEYEHMQPDAVRTQQQENMYEMLDIKTDIRDDYRFSEPAEATSRNVSKKSAWNKPFFVLTVLLCLNFILLVAVLILVLSNTFAKETSCSPSHISANSNESLCTEWTNNIISKFNSASNVTGSLPDFDEWANGVVSKVNSNVTGSLPDFDEWANGVSQNTLQLFQNNTNFTELDKQILQTTRDSAQKLINIVNTLSNLQDTSTSTAGVVDDILLIVFQRLVLGNESFTSCKELKSQYPSSPSGYYVLASGDGSSTYTAYCNMGLLCGSGGGWTRLAYLDMSDATQNCPSNLRLYQSGGVRACGKQVVTIGCVSVQFPSNGISYSQICGRVTGYQYHSTDGISTHIIDLNSYYVDGVSITRGSPRQHVWTLMAGNSESSSASQSCPCNTGSSVSVQSFVGNNYFCESGNTASSASNVFYTSDPLWDGQGCGSLESPCCNVPGIPWFHRDYGSNTTTDYIELRLCADFDDEDTPVSYYEIYVK